MIKFYAKLFLHAQWDFHLSVKSEKWGREENIQNGVSGKYKTESILNRFLSQNGWIYINFTVSEFEVEVVIENPIYKSFWKAVYGLKLANLQN